MSLPIAWVEKIFEKLSLTYGRDFLVRWEGQDLRRVQEEWAKDLGSLFEHPDAIAFALENLPVKAPTVVEFRKLAREWRPAEKPLKLEQGLRPDPVRVQQAILRIADRPAQVNGRQWAYDLLARHERGDRRPVACLRMAREAIAMDGGALVEEVA